MRTFFFTIIVAACGVLNSQDLSRRGSDFSVRELKQASMNRASFDQGLTAEWLLALRLLDNGLSPEDATDYFIAGVEDRVNYSTPKWFKDRVLRVSFKGEENEEQLPRTTFELKESFPAIARKSAKATMFFSQESQSTKAIIATDRGFIRSELYLIPVLSGESHRKVRSFPTRTWCPAFEGFDSYDEAGISLEDFRFPAISILLREDGRVLIFGDVASRFFISVFDADKQVCELSFMSKRRYESACINCVEVARPGMGG